MQREGINFSLEKASLGGDGFEIEFKEFEHVIRRGRNSWQRKQ